MISQVATEYENIAQEFIIQKGMDASIRRSTGSTEVFPPEDADFEDPPDPRFPGQLDGRARDFDRAPLKF